VVKEAGVMERVHLRNKGVDWRIILKQIVSVNL
jgi:hypothetical protein